MDAEPAIVGEVAHEPLPARGASPSELLAEIYRLGQLSYGVVLEATSLHRLERVLGYGEFPSDPKTLESLLLVTELANIVRGTWLAA